MPVSTPGYDSAPYLTATACVTRDPDSGIQNLGTYRGGLKAPDRIGLKLFMNLGQGGTAHWEKHRVRGEAMPIAMVIGCPPPVAYCGPQKLPKDTDELGVAGGIAGAPIRISKARTSDLMVPADAEIVIEGLLDPEYFEPEGPFGESHGYINLEEFNFILKVTAITRKKNAVFTSIISQVTPSESPLKRWHTSRYFSITCAIISASAAWCGSACTAPRSGVPYTARCRSRNPSANT